ncbi:MAG TPA: CoA transferase [Dehalococcoidia bacterium]|nr:CoA transferase [Dehalococcoidia bacterium]
MNNQPLKGIRVADFGQIVAMPFTAQILGWLGAEVILVETKHRLTTRAWPPFAEAEPGVNRSGGFNTINNTKLGCTLNLREPQGMELAKRLISISDIVAENYSTGTMERMGIGYQDMQRLRPDVIYLSLGAFGRTGPMKDLAGFHSVINLFSGLAAVTGHTGSHPRILGGIFPDPFSGCYCVLSILEALYHRANTGEGQYIEVAMTEALATLLPEAVMEYSLNGKEAERVGNKHKDKSPHDIFRCKGNQRWVAISVDGSSQWQTLCLVMEHPEWRQDPRFAGDDNRQKNQDQLNPLIEAWTLSKTPEEVAGLLQSAGVAATPVMDSDEVLADPHMIERGFVTQVEHQETGSRPMGTVSWAIDGERPSNFRPAPLLGEHNQYVFCNLLGLSEEEVNGLVESGVIE